jgi:hypothetical protein
LGQLTGRRTFFFPSLHLSPPLFIVYFIVSNLNIMAEEGEQNVAAMEESQQQDFIQKQPREGSLLESIRNMKLTGVSTTEGPGKSPSENSSLEILSTQSREDVNVSLNVNISSKTASKEDLVTHDTSDYVGASPAYKRRKGSKGVIAAKRGRGVMRLR